VAPSSMALRVNLAVPLSPTVVLGLPPQNSMVPAMPPQMESMATFWSWKTIELEGMEVSSVVWREEGREDVEKGGGTNPSLVHVVLVTASGLTVSSPLELKERTAGCGIAIALTEEAAAQRIVKRIEVYIFAECVTRTFW